MRTALRQYRINHRLRAVELEMSSAVKQALDDRTHGRRLEIWILYCSM